MFTNCCCKCRWTNQLHVSLTTEQICCSILGIWVIIIINHNFCSCVSNTFARVDTLYFLKKWWVSYFGTWLACPLKSFPVDFFSVLPHRLAISNSIQLVIAGCCGGHSQQFIIILVCISLFVCLCWLTFCLPYGQHWFGNKLCDPPDRLTVLLAISLISPYCILVL